VTKGVEDSQVSLNILDFFLNKSLNQKCDHYPLKKNYSLGLQLVNLSKNVNYCGFLGSKTFNNTYKVIMSHTGFEF
jgi:hypothetical protein